MYTTINLLLAIFAGLIIGYILGHQARNKDDEIIKAFQDYKIKQLREDAQYLKELLHIRDDAVMAIDTINEAMRETFAEQDETIKMLYKFIASTFYPLLNKTVRKEDDNA